MQDQDNPNESSLIFHLEALRKMLIHSFIALGIGIIPMFFAAPYALDFLSERIVASTNASLHYFSPMEVFLLQLKLAALFDVALCFPFIAWEIWKFILPALYDDDRNLLRGLVWVSSSLFAIGVAFFLSLCFPLILRFGASFSTESLLPVFGISHIVSLGVWLSLAFGCLFQFPILTYALVRWGIFSYESVQKKRPFVIILILVLAALLTPPDIVSLRIWLSLAFGVMFPFPILTYALVRWGIFSYESVQKKRPFIIILILILAAFLTPPVIVSQLMLGTPTYLLFEAGLFFARKYRNTPTMKEQRDARDLASFDVFAPNGGSKKMEETERETDGQDARQGGEHEG